MQDSEDDMKRIIFMAANPTLCGLGTDRTKTGRSKARFAAASKFVDDNPAQRRFAGEKVIRACCDPMGAK